MASAEGKQHDYHIIDPSPWPILSSIGAFVLMFGAVLLPLSIAIMTYTSWSLWIATALLGVS